MIFPLKTNNKSLSSNNYNVIRR